MSIVAALIGCGLVAAIAALIDRITPEEHRK